MIKRLKRKLIYGDAWMKLFADEVEFPSGKKGTYASVERKNGAAVVVVNEKNEVLLAKVYRYPIDDYSWEIPGGGIDEGEDEAASVIRELEEETGVKLGGVELVGEWYLLNSMSTEKQTVFVARVKEFGELKINDEDEGITELKAVAFEEALAMIDRREINDAMSANALQVVWRRLQRAG